MLETMFVPANVWMKDDNGMERGGNLGTDERQDENCLKKMQEIVDN